MFNCKRTGPRECTIYSPDGKPYIALTYPDPDKRPAMLSGNEAERREAFVSRVAGEIVDKLNAPKGIGPKQRWSYAPEAPGTFNVFEDGYRMRTYTVHKGVMDPVQWDAAVEELESDVRAFVDDMNLDADEQEPPRPFGGDIGDAPAPFVVPGDNGFFSFLEAITGQKRPQMVADPEAGVYPGCGDPDCVACEGGPIPLPKTQAEADALFDGIAKRLSAKTGKKVGIVPVTLADLMSALGKRPPGF